MLPTWSWSLPVAVVQLLLAICDPSYPSLIAPQCCFEYSSFVSMLKCKDVDRKAVRSLFWKVQAMTFVVDWTTRENVVEQRCNGRSCCLVCCRKSRVLSAAFVTLLTCCLHSEYIWHKLNLRVCARTKQNKERIQETQTYNRSDQQSIHDSRIHSYWTKVLLTGIVVINERWQSSGTSAFKGWFIFLSQLPSFWYWCRLHFSMGLITTLSHCLENHC